MRRTRSAVDTASITGESVPIDVDPGDQVFNGPESAFVFVYHHLVARKIKQGAVKHYDGYVHPFCLFEFGGVAGVFGN